MRAREPAVGERPARAARRGGPRHAARGGAVRHRRPLPALLLEPRWRTGRSFDEVKAEREREAEQASQRWADPAKIASVAVFLASSRASYVNGADLLVDIGWVAR